MPVQLLMEFDTVHRKENNPESQAVLELRRDDFNKQCWAALVRMLNGDRINNKDKEIGHMARRAKDLKDFFKIPVEADYALDENGVQLKWKWYHILPENRPAVMKRIINFLIVTKTNQ